MGCRICGSGEVTTTWRAHGAVLRIGETFTYEACAECACVQIAEVSGDPHPYDGPGAAEGRSPFAGPLRSHQLRYLATGRGLLGRVANRLRPFAGSVVDPCVPKDARILEVGCGNGSRLMALLAKGYRDLTGIDPQMPVAAERVSPVRLARMSLLEMDPGGGLYGAVVFGDALEHLAEQHETAEKLRELLAPAGVSVLQVTGVQAGTLDRWRTDEDYLDAPRRLYLHSRESLALLMAAHGLCVDRFEGDRADAPISVWLRPDDSP